MRVDKVERGKHGSGCIHHIVHWIAERWQSQTTRSESAIHKVSKSASNVVPTLERGRQQVTYKAPAGHRARQNEFRHALVAAMCRCPRV
eukprot:2479569-Amphidinium_carterae.1